MNLLLAYPLGTLIFLPFGRKKLRDCGKLIEETDTGKTGESKPPRNVCEEFELESDFQNREKRSDDSITGVETTAIIIALIVPIIIVIVAFAIWIAGAIS